MHNRPQHQPQPYQQPTQGGNEGGQEVGGLPAFITGGGGQPQQNPGQNQNGHDQGDRSQDRFAGIDGGGGIVAVVASVLTVRILAAVHQQGAAPQPAQDEGGGDEPRQPD